jgi:hypothetical protein
MQIPFVVHIDKSGTELDNRIDRTNDFPGLAEIGLNVASKVGAELLSIDIIVESKTGKPFCIDVNLGNALTGVNNGIIMLLTYLAKKVTEKTDYPSIPFVSSIT